MRRSCARITAEARHLPTPPEYAVWRKWRREGVSVALIAHLYRRSPREVRSVTARVRK